MENSDDEALPMENFKEEALPMENYKEEALPMENFDDDDDATLFRSVLMLEVLGKLSLPDIARLSCVCRSFRDLLTESPFLTIDDSIFQGTYFQRYINGQNISKLSHDLERFIDWIFRRHNAKLHTFAIIFGKNFGSSVSLDSAKLSQWLTAAASKQVRNIMIHAYASDIPVVRGEVFLCKDLVVLKLHGISFAFCPSHDSSDIMPYLSEFSLLNVQITEESFNHFVRSCPRLQNLSLRNCIDIENVEVHSKSLVSFQFHCTWAMNFSHISLTAVCPALDSLLVRFDRNIFVSSQAIKFKVSAPRCRILETNCSLLGQFRSLEQLERLTVCQNTLCRPVLFSLLADFPKIEWACLSCVDVRSIDFGMQFQYLKYLRFPITHYGLEEIAFMGCILRSSPAMENMKVDVKCCVLQKMLGRCEKCEKQLDEGAFRVQMSELEKANSNSKVVLVNHRSLIFRDSLGRYIASAC